MFNQINSMNDSEPILFGPLSNIDNKLWIVWVWVTFARSAEEMFQLGGPNEGSHVLMEILGSSLESQLHLNRLYRPTNTYGPNLEV